MRVAGNVLMRLILAGAVMFILFSNLSGRDGSSDPPPGNTGGARSRMITQEPISASAQTRLNGQDYLFLTTKQGEARIETADLRIVLVDPGEGLDQVSLIHTSMSVETPPSALAVVRGYVYIGMARQGDDRPALGIVDVSDPGEPVDANLISVDAPIVDLAGNENGLLVSVTVDGDVDVFDLTRPDQPEVRRSFSLDVSAAPRIDLSGATLLVDDMESIVLIDLSNPEDPPGIARLRYPGSSPPAGRRTSRDYLTGEEPFDIAVPPDRFLDVVFDGELIAAAAGDLGLLLLGSGETGRLSELAVLEVPGRAVALALDGELVHLLAAGQGEGSEARFRLHTIDITDPSRPRILDTSRAITGRPRHQEVRVLDGQVMLLIDNAVTRLQDGAPGT